MEQVFDSFNSSAAIRDQISSAVSHSSPFNISAANNVSPYQTALEEQTDLGPHYLPVCQN